AMPLCDTSTASVMPSTGTGVLELDAEPLPSCPSRPRPQQTTAPPVRTAHADSTPKLTCVASVSPVTSTGPVAGEVVPLPSSPSPLLLPQHSTVPEERIPQASPPQISICSMLVSPMTVM